jgi:hypothetical protein
LQKWNAEEVEKLNEEIENYNESLKITNKKKAEYNELFKWQESQKIRKFMVKTEMTNTKGTAPFAFLWCNCFGFDLSNYFILEDETEINVLDNKYLAEKKESDQRLLKKTQVEKVKVEAKKYSNKIEPVDAIILPTDESLIDFKGISKDIYTAGGDELKDNCDRIKREHGRLPAGCTKLVSSGSLPAKHCILALLPAMSKLLPQSPKIHRIIRALMMDVLSYLIDGSGIGKQNILSIDSIMIPIVKMEGIKSERLVQNVIQCIGDFSRKNESELSQGVAICKLLHYKFSFWRRR